MTDGNRGRDPQPNIRLGESYGRGGGRIKGDREVKDTTRKPTESTNLGPWGLTETEPPTRKPARD